MSFFRFGLSSSRSPGRDHFSIDDAFDAEDDEGIINNGTPSSSSLGSRNQDNEHRKKTRRHLSSGSQDVIPEEEDDDQVDSQGPIIKTSGQLRLDLTSENVPHFGNGSSGMSIGGNDQGQSSDQDSASLIQGENQMRAESGYYEGPPSVKYWWRHPKIRDNYKLVLAAFCLVFLGAGMMGMQVSD